MTIEQSKERLIALEKLKIELDRSRKIAMLAPDDDYKQGYMKAMSNVFAIVNEEIRITEQLGNPEILF